MFLLKLLPFAKMLHRKVLSERIGCTAAIPHVFQVLPSQKVKQCRSFDNYVDQVLSNFNHLPPSSGQLWTFYLLSTLSQWLFGPKKISFHYWSAPRGPRGVKKTIKIFEHSSILMGFFEFVSFGGNLSAKGKHFHLWKKKCDFLTPLGPLGADQ